MTIWNCVKCGFGHNAEVTMIHHQITVHKAKYSVNKLLVVKYARYLKRIKPRKRNGKR